jgi:ribosomal protein S25
MPDNQKFRKVCEQIIHAERNQNGIGTLGEKSLHAVLKHYYEPNTANHEQKIGLFVADIITEDGIIEIQTRAFDRLRKKLTEFLKIAPVTVVYPIPSTKWLLWIDEATGETTKKRKSPKRGSIYDSINELYKIKSMLNHPNFRLCMVFIDMEEYRCLNGWSKDKKKGSTRFDRIPIDIVDEVYINNTVDFLKFIPTDLTEQFTSKNFAKAAKIRLDTAQTALNILHHIGVVRRVGKQGNMHIYERNI